MDRLYQVKDADLMRLRQMACAAFKTQTAGVVSDDWIRDHQFASILEQCGLKCTKQDVQNARHHLYKSFNCVKTEAAESALRKLTDWFPAIKPNTWWGEVQQQPTKPHRISTARDAMSPEDKIKWRFLQGNLSKAASRKDAEGNRLYVVEIDVSYLMEIGRKQNWKCAYTGIPLEFTRGGGMFAGQVGNQRVCTADRIDSSKGYIENNVVLACWGVNKMKSTMTVDEMLFLCRAVADHHRI